MLRLCEDALGIHGDAGRRGVVLPDIVGAGIGEEFGDVTFATRHVPLPVKGQVRKDRGTLLHVGT